MQGSSFDSCQRRGDKKPNLPFALFRNSSLEFPTTVRGWPGARAGRYTLASALAMRHKCRRVLWSGAINGLTVQVLQLGAPEVTETKEDAK